MGPIDVALLGALAISVVVGLMRGLVFELLSVLGWFAAYFAARWLTPELASQMPIGRPGLPINHAATFAAIFIAAVLAWAVVSRMLRFLIHASPLSVPDRMLGGVFGLLRGLILLLAVATVVSFTPLATSKPWQASVIAPWLQQGLDALRPLLPPPLSQHLPAPRPAR